MSNCSAIQGVIVRGNSACVTACEEMRIRGFDVRPIRSPTVSKGTGELETFRRHVFVFFFIGESF